LLVIMSDFFGNPTVNDFEGPRTGKGPILGDDSLGQARAVNSSTFTFDNTLTVVATPEPSSLLLLGAGLVGVGVVRSRRKRSKS
jgi:hypothetical protein